MIDVEIVGFNKDIDVLLEIVVFVLKMDEYGVLSIDYIVYFYVELFEGVNIE